MPETRTPPSATPSKARPAARRRPTPAAPWIIDGIDYGPALVAIDELMAWAFDLAARGVGDAAGKRRVQRARRAVAAMLRGKRRRLAAGVEDDVTFTAMLLVRILDADLRLGLGDIVTVLTELGLPTADVPTVATPPPGRPVARVVRPAAAAMPPAPTVSVTSVAELSALVDALRPRGSRPPGVPTSVPVAPSPFAGMTRLPAHPCAGCCLARPDLGVAA